MYDRILIPTDISTGVENAIEHAIDAAQRYDAELHVLHVVDSEVYSSYSGDEYVHEFEGLESALERAGKEAVEEVRERAQGEGVETVTALKHGVPHDEILNYAEENRIDLIIMGTKDKPGEYRRLLGSVTQRVAGMTKLPVTVVKTRVEEE